MKKAAIISGLIFIASALWAQGTSSLEAVCESLSSHPITTGDFIQIKTIQTNGRKLKSTGTYIISPEGIVWNTEKPISSSLILTETAVVQVAANGKKSVLSGNDNQIFANVSETLSSVLSGNVTALKKNFNCEFTMDKSGEWTISLNPKDSTIASVMKTLVLTGTYQESAVMTSLVMLEASGNTISYEFVNQKFPKELSADEKKIFIVE